MSRLKPFFRVAALAAAVALAASPASGGLTRVYTDEIKNVAATSSLGIAQGELLSDSLTRIGNQGAAPLRLSATGADSLLRISASEVTDGDGGGKVLPPVGGSVNTALAATTIDFQASTSIVSPSGNVLTDGGAFAFPSTTIGQFRQVALAWRSDGKVDSHFSPAAASVGALEDPGTTFAALAGSQKLGYVVLEATASQKFKTAGSATSIIQVAVSGTPRIIRVSGGSIASMTDISGILATPNGGTGQNSTATFPTSGVVVTESATETLTNKSINGGTNTLTAIPLTTAVTGILPGTNGGIGVSSTATFPTSGVVVTEAATETLTNKTLTSPVVNTPTGIVKGDVGLGSVDNTSDATKNAASVTLTNHTISGTANTLTNIATENDFSGDGTTTDFTLSSPAQVMSASKLVQVFVDGRLQREGGGNAYTRTNASPGHIVFTSAPNSGSWVAVIVVNQ